MAVHSRTVSRMVGPLVSASVRIGSRVAPRQVADEPSARLMAERALVHLTWCTLQLFFQPSIQSTVFESAGSLGWKSQRGVRLTSGLAEIAPQRWKPEISEVSKRLRKLMQATVLHEKTRLIHPLTTFLDAAKKEMLQAASRIFVNTRISFGDFHIHMTPAVL